MSGVVWKEEAVYVLPVLGEASEGIIVWKSVRISKNTALEPGGTHLSQSLTRSKYVLEDAIFPERRQDISHVRHQNPVFPNGKKRYI